MSKSYKHIHTHEWFINEALLSDCLGLLKLEIKQLERKFPGCHTVVSHEGSEERKEQEILGLGATWYKYRIDVYGPE